MRILTVFLILIFPSVNIFSQVTLSGKVLNNKRLPVVVGDIFLLSATDSSMVKSALVKDGAFAFDPVGKGSYVLKVSSMGFQVEIQKVTLEADTSLIVIMEESIGLLGGVTVSGSKRTFTIENGNLRIKIDGSIFSSIPNTVDLISKLPKVHVNPDGESIDVIGKGEALIYVDNQRATLNELNAIPVREIKDVQIINNPSAKFEANGRVVILVTRKLSVREGINAELTESASFRRRFSNRLGLNLNYKRKKLEFRTGLQYNRRQTWESNTFDFRIDNQNIQSGYFLTDVILTPEYTASAGLYYQFNDEDYISINTTCRIQRRSFPIYTNSYLKDLTGENNVFTINKSKYPSSFYTSNINYRKGLKKNGELFLGVQYSNYNEKFSSKIYNDKNYTQTIFSEDRVQNYGVDVLTGRVDLEKKIKNRITWSMGCNISHAKANAKVDINNFDPPGSFSSNYHYSEESFGAYTQLVGKLKKVDYSAGLRAETTDVEGAYNNSNSNIIDRHYTNLFPKLSISIPLDSTSTLSLNYAGSIARPNYVKVTQVSNYINPYFEWASNINLRPTITKEISGSLQFKTFSVGLAWFQNEGSIFSNFVYDQQAIKLTRTDLNYKKETGINMNLTVPIQHKKFTSLTQVYGIYSKLTDPVAVVGNAKPYIYFYSANELKLTKGAAISVSGWGLSKIYDGIFERKSMLSVDINFTKAIGKNLNCAVGVNDIFQSLNSTEKFTVNDVVSSGKYYDGTRELLIVFRYSLGSIKNSKYKSRTVDESINRVQ